MIIKPAYILLSAMAVASISNSYADENFQLCVNPSYAEGITLKYNSDKSGCVVESHTTHNFDSSNQYLSAFHAAPETSTLQEDNGSFHFHNINTTTVSIGGGFLPYTVVFESHHKVLGIVAHGNCNIRSERSERAAIDVYKNDRQVSSFTCFHPADLDNTYCQQTMDSDVIGIAFGKVESRPICTEDEDLSGTVAVLIYNTAK